MFDIVLYLSTGALIIYFLFIYYLTWNYNHWKNMNIPFIEPKLFYGNAKDMLLMTKNKGIVYDEYFKQTNEPAIGIFIMRQPQLVIRDPSLVKILTINAFSNFRENFVYSEKNDFFLSTNVFFYSGEEWKKRRGIITPALTMSKLKLFIPYMVEVTKEMVWYLDENLSKEMEAKQFTGLYTLETAMSYTYGVKCDAFRNPESMYRKTFDLIFAPTKWFAFKMVVSHFWPSVGHFFRLGITPKKFVDFWLSIVKGTMEYKKNNKLGRKDFLQFLIDTSENDNSVKELSVYEMAGLTMNLAADGTETTNVALISIIDALIRYPQHQIKLREQIKSKINKLDDITYENINSISYLNAFILEALRVIPPASVLEKKCTTECVIAYKGKEYKFRKGDTFAIPIYSIHMDPKYFPNPMEFSPERFLANEEILGYMPFGNGPRACLGRPFALIQMKVFLCALLLNYEVVPKGNKVHDIKFDPNSSIFMLMKGGVWFKVNKLQ